LALQTGCGKQCFSVPSFLPLIPYGDGKMKRNLLLSLSALLAAVLISSLFSQEALKGPVTEAATGPAAPGRLQVYVMDVGRGQSVLVISPVGKAALIDAGGVDAGSRVVNELRRRSVQKLEVVVATQAGADYVGGLRRVAGSSDIVIKNFIDSAQPWKTDAYQQTLAAVQSANVPVTAARRGQIYDLGGGARLDILNPVGDGTWVDATDGTSRENINGVVVRLIYRGFAMLIMGGAGAQAAESMLQAGQNIWAPVLVLGNGASGSSTSEKMLSIVQPKFAILSASQANAPAPETIERLRASKAEILRTDVNGEITITTDGKDQNVAPERK
jgi:competence protein ComEC